jgi:hypothetical protein
VTKIMNIRFFRQFNRKSVHFYSVHGSNPKMIIR